MVPRPLAPARAMSSRTCADVIQPCSLYPLLHYCYERGLDRKFRRTRTSDGHNEKWRKMVRFQSLRLITHVFDIIPTNKLWELLFVAFVSASPAIVAENEDSIGKTGIAL